MQVEGQHVPGLPGMMATGARVSNAYPTYLLQRDSLAKVRLIPHDFGEAHVLSKKGAIRQRMGVRPISWLAG